ncbi:MAG: CD225/dispanin family protein [Thermoguttaceae bacterium]
MQELSTDGVSWERAAAQPGLFAAEIVEAPAQQPAGAGQPPRDQPAVQPAPSAPLGEALWYYLKGGTQPTPIGGLGDLQLLLIQGQLWPNDLVWTEGMRQWAPVRTVPALWPAQKLHSDYGRQEMQAVAAAPSGTPMPYPPSGNVKYCFQCGRVIDAVAPLCPGCGAEQPGSPYTSTSSVPRRHVPTYVAQAILCTLFCCLPFGIVALVYAAQVNGMLAVGDYYGAVKASATARTWCWASFITGLATLGLFGLYLLGVWVP